MPMTHTSCMLCPPCCDSIGEVIKILQDISKLLLKEFEGNQIKTNADKCHLIMSVNNPITVAAGSKEIANNRAEKLLGTTFDRELKTATPINGLSKKSSNSIRALVY